MSKASPDSAKGALALGETFGSRRGIARQAVWLSVASAAAQGVVALMYIAVARQSTPGTYGPVVVAIGIGSAAVGLIDFGSNTLWVRELARRALSANVVAERGFVKVALGWGLAAGWSVLSFTVLPTFLWPAGLLGAAILTNQTAQVFLRGLGRADAVAVTVLLERVSGALLLGLLLLAAVPPLVALPIALICGALVSAGAAYWTGRPRGARRVALRVQNPWAGARHFGLGVAAQTGSSFDLPLLGAVGGPVAAGLYGAVNRWTQPMGLLAAAFASALTPYVANVGSLRAAAGHIRKALWLLVIALLACIAVAVLAPSIVTVLVGNQFSGAGSVLQLLALGTIPAILNQPLAGALQAVGRERAVAFIIAAGVVLQLGLIAIFGSALGAIGAAVAFLLLQSGLLTALTVVATRAGRRTGPLQ